MKFTDLTTAKLQLNIEDSYYDDDIYICQLLNVSEIAISNYCNEDWSTYTTIPVTISQAAYLLTAHLYANRQVVSFATQAGAEIPYTFQFLLNPYKNFVIQ